MENAPTRQRRPKTGYTCFPCRRRKVRCDRTWPCSRCKVSGDPEGCRYDVSRTSKTSTSVVPEQIVFTANSEPSGLKRPNHGICSPFVLFAQPGASPQDDEANSHLCLRLPFNLSQATETFINPVSSRGISVTRSVLKGGNDETTHWGSSHVSIPALQFPDIINFLVSNKDDVQFLFSLKQPDPKTSSMAFPVTDQHQQSALRCLLPRKELTTELINLYVDNLESCCRFVHIPSLYRELSNLWDRPDEVKDATVAMILGMCAISSRFMAENMSDLAFVRNRSIQWIDAIRSWLFGQDSGTKTTLSYMQVYCLMLLACQMNSVYQDEAWISTGTLVRTAIAGGLHREPSDFSGITPFYAEMRRRLWFSILELDLQKSFDEGRVPYASPDDYDCAAPLNIEDEQLIETMNQAPVPQPPNRIARGSYQLFVSRSWPLRWRVCRTINKPKLEVPYEEVLQMDSELKAFINEAIRITRIERGQLRRFLLEIMMHKVVLSLHQPFAARASSDPRFLYSRQACVYSSIAILSRISDAYDTQTRYSTTDNIATLCQTEICNSIQFLCRELLTQATEKRHSMDTSASLIEKSQRDARIESWFKPHQELVMALVERATAVFLDKSAIEGTTRRMSNWLRLVINVSKTMVNGGDTTKAMEESLKQSIQAYRGAKQASQSRYLGQTGSEDNAGSEIFDMLASNVNLFDDEDTFNFLFTPELLGISP